MDAKGPETTQSLGALTAAIARPAGIQARSSISPMRTDIMPPAGCSCMAAALAQISFIASSSEKTPARHAATYSQTLWQIIHAGRKHQDCHRLARSYSTANIAGCVY